MVSVRLDRKSGPIDLVRPDGSVATLSQPGQPDRRISLKRRGLAECLADELRHLDDDDVYATTLTRGLTTLRPARQTASEAAARGEAPSTSRSRKLAARLARNARAEEALAMVEAPPRRTTATRRRSRRRTARKRAGQPTAREKTVAKRPAKKATRKPASS